MITETPHEDAVEMDGLMVIESTGEIVSVAVPLHIQQHEPEAEDNTAPLITESYAEWITGRMTRHESKMVSANAAIAELQAEKDELIRKAMAKLAMTPEWIEIEARERSASRVWKDASKALDFLHNAFDEALRLFAKYKLTGRKSRTLHLLNGAISLKRKSAKLVVDDEDKAIAHFKAKGVAACIKESFLISGIPDTDRATLLDSTNADAETMLAEAGLRVESESEEVTVKTNIVTKEAA